MAMITSIRAPLPVAETPLLSTSDPRRLGSVAHGAASASATDLAQAVQHMPPRPPATDAALLAMRTTVEDSAAQAAEAARAAYIRASIAAGINPLPLA
jgi:hypothetical protein